MARETSEPRGTRDRIVAASTELFGRQGYTGTGLKAILTASNTPFGSLYHFFPGGKEELGAEAIRVAGRTYRELVEAFYAPGIDVATATSNFFEGAAAMIVDTDFADACPIATVALEVSSTSEAMRQAAAEAFNSWLSVLERRLTDSGVNSERATELAIELFCAIEGAFLLSRATRSPTPIRVVGRSMTAAVGAATPFEADRRG